MRVLPIVVIAGSLIAGHAFGPTEQGSKPTKTVALHKAGLLKEATNSQKRVVVPGAGQTFLWVKATASAAQTIDLTRVSLVGGASSSTLLGIDGTFDGDPTRFAMIGSSTLKGGGPSAPLEESWSAGSIAFAFTPGQTATLKIIQPPQSFCLLFSVPKAFQTGQIKGLGPADLNVPSIPHQR
jgi:hypothetical protein